jgi:hypothetical protein
MTDKNLLTAGKVAAALGVSQGQVKKAIEAAGVKPSIVKAGCSYYDDVCVEKIKKALK